MKQQYIDLADRCEAAEAGSRELDALIAAAVGWEHRSGQPWSKVIEWEKPSYTTSIDAALTLLPDGWQVDSLSKWDAAPESADNPSQARSRVYLLETSIKRMGREMIWGHSSNGDRRVEAVSSTPALALLAAICRAMGEG